MFRPAVLITLFSLAVCQFHHHHPGGFISGGNHEHPEQGSVNFVYDPDSHYLISSTHSTCYFMPLTTDQQTSVHNHGLENLELQMMAMMSGGEEQLTSDQVAKHTHIISSMCNSHKLYMVGAPVAKPSVSSPEH
ncbi:uncharacterized protein LOC110463994 [Mizuhopecten yessoensis]|uniref:Uncharacterized protein n=1 Tax=Mizuhopecten yessoensis TaxID=6573 RepID=A0A210PUX7_MIZYE|nr:uncharacterized protein LOC110463994 [Mizuhopecten yessoensis]OWF40301.1 hypothetical protein KP79_PYT21655 [Mizuhopecten yessoensis]